MFARGNGVRDMKQTNLDIISITDIYGEFAEKCSVCRGRILRDFERRLKYGYFWIVDGEIYPKDKWQKFKESNA